MQWKFPEAGNKASESLVPSNANAIIGTISSHAKPCSFEDSESFYQKVKESLDSSGFTLVFDVRPKVLDLYLLYLEVNRRGGYHQVSKEGKWGELATALKMEGKNNVKLPFQLEKLYANLLYKIEEMYCSESATKQAEAQGSEEPRVQRPPIFHAGRSSKKKRNSSKAFSSSMTGIFATATPSENETNKRKGLPIRPRNCYQIFLKNECTAFNGKVKLSRALATQKWRNLSETERQRYVELSVLDKARYIREMNDFRLQNAIAGKGSSLNGDDDGDGDSHVTPHPDAERVLVSNTALMDLALIKALKAPENSLDWNVYNSHKV